MKANYGIYKCSSRVCKYQVVCFFPVERTKVLCGVLDMLRWFAGQQIRNVAVSSAVITFAAISLPLVQTLGGNLCNASPISDLNPLLMAAGAVANLASVDGQRSLPVDANFFTGYKQTAIRPNEVLVSVEIPFTAEVSQPHVLINCLLLAIDFRMSIS